ncbi:MAG: type II toxin-antitoxin system VapC family toxin [Candidatus Eremiobacteraeota bacterium]|nr:type II toxin-antitoxin system VapC family toxin [Candidatus Eremiobacteraeota bacterium]
MSPILLDTHVAMWAVGAELPKAAWSVIDAAAERGELLISPITAWEIGVLVQKNRLTLTTPLDEYVRALFGRPGVVTAALTPAVALASTTLPGTLHGDPADRILVATAAAFGADLVTRDRRLHEYARTTKHIRCIRC